MQTEKLEKIIAEKTIKLSENRVKMRSKGFNHSVGVISKIILNNRVKAYGTVNCKPCVFFLYEIEKGKKGFSATTLLNISKALEVSLDYIMTGAGSGKYDDEIVATLEKFKLDTLVMVDRLLKTAYEISKDGR